MLDENLISKGLAIFLKFVKSYRVGRMYRGGRGIYI